MKILSIIEARMGSTRFPGKIMKHIIHRPMLDLLIERLRRAERIDEIIVATTNRTEDDCIVNLTERLGIRSYRGSPENVLDRILQAAKTYQGDVIVEMTADCPLLDPRLIDEMIEMFLKSEFDYVGNTLKETFPQGLTIRIYSTRTLEEVSCLTHNPIDLEHPSVYIWSHPALYKFYNVEAPPEYRHPEYRWTVDYTEDLKLIREIYGHLYADNPEFSTKDIIQLMKTKPELAKINAHCKTKSDKEYSQLLTAKADGLLAGAFDE